MGECAFNAPNTVSLPILHALRTSSLLPAVSNVGIDRRTPLWCLDDAVRCSGIGKRLSSCARS